MAVGMELGCKALDLHEPCVLSQHHETQNTKQHRTWRTILKATMPHTQKPSILRQENQQYEASLCYTVRLCAKTKTVSKKKWVPHFKLNEDVTKCNEASAKGAS